MAVNYNRFNNAPILIVVCSAFHSSFWIFIEERLISLNFDIKSFTAKNWKGNHGECYFKDEMFVLVADGSDVRSKIRVVEKL